MKYLIDHTPRMATKYFSSYEEREESFRKIVFSLIPRKYSGPRLFWSDFKNITLDELMKFIRQPCAYITSNPRDGLAFGTPWQVLRAAVMSARKTNQARMLSVEKIAADYVISDLLMQPLRTLSGGETVKLALAKASIASYYSNKLIIASPFSWLSRENKIFFQKLYDHYARSEIPIELFALEGEDSEEPVNGSDFQRAFWMHTTDFILHLKGLQISLGSSLNPIHSRQAVARVEDFESALVSPCLIVGENGQGKSLIAKVLAGAIAFDGRAEIVCEETSGPARLLFQDVISQTLLRSFDAIAATSSPNNGLKPIELCEAILKASWEYATHFGKSVEEKKYLNSNGFRSLLEVKAILIAVRLCNRPNALILDEPDWGLTRASAIALVAAVIKIAHELGTPVILISHKPWWPTIANSIIQVERTPKTINDKGGSSFEIRLSRC